MEGLLFFSALERINRHLSVPSENLQLVTLHISEYEPMIREWVQQLIFADCCGFREEINLRVNRQVRDKISG
jgi:hypothetical protein